MTYTLGGPDAGSFNFDTTSGQLQTKNALDKETKSNYTVTVSVRDSKDASGNIDSADDDTITVTITVTGENEPPTFDATLDPSLEVAENTAAGENIGTPFTATDPDNGDMVAYTLDTTSDAVFDIDASGQLKTEAALDFEDKNNYTVTITATDGSAATDTIVVTITVTNVDEDGAVTFLPTQPKAGTLLTATLEDLDGSVSGETWEWSKSTSATGTFTPITGETSDTYTPAADDVGKFLKAKATYTDGHGPNKSAETVTISAVASGNTPPEFSSPFAFTVAENAAENALVGTVSATDSDNDTLTYSLDSDTAEVTAFNSVFNLDTATGEITVKTGASPDYEEMALYQGDGRRDRRQGRGW